MEQQPHGLRGRPSAYPDLSGDYVFGGTVVPGDPAGLTVSFNSGCVWNTYHGHVTEGGDMVLVGTALGTSEDCSLTGDDSEGLMLFGRKGGRAKED